MPARSDFNPAEIKSILPYIAMARVERNPRRYQLTLVGTDTVSAMGEDITNKYLDEVPLLLHNAKERYDWIVENKRPYIFAGEAEWSDKSYLNYYSIALPFSENENDVDRIMWGGIYYYPDDNRTIWPAFHSEAMRRPE